jgi:hypothetical protein
MAKDNVTEIREERLKRGLGSADFKSGGGGGGKPPEMSDILGRLGKLETTYDVLKFAIGIMVAVMLGGFAFLGTQISRLDSKLDTSVQRLDANAARLNDKIDANAARVNEKLDAIPLRLAEEFRAMRAEMSAQTSAIAGSITAARQAPPQVLLVPAPAVAPPAQKP